MSLPDRLAETILSTGSDAIVSADRDGIIGFWNPGAERLFGYSREEAVSRSLDLIIRERLRKRHWDGYSRVMQTGQSRYGQGDVLSVPALRKDGTIISVEFTVVPLKNEAEQMIGMAAIIRDVTARYNEMRGLKQALADVGRTATNKP